MFYIFCRQRQRRSISVCRQLVSQFVLCISTLFFTTSLMADSAESFSDEPFTSSLDLSTAISLTMAYHPVLQQYPLRLQRLDAEQLTAEQRPAYQLGAELENVAGTGDTSGVQALETTLALSSVIELGGKREARIGLVDAQREIVAADQRVAALDIIADVTRRYLNVTVLQAQLEVAADAERQARRAVSSVRKRVNAGATPNAELRRARAALAEAKIASNRLQHQLRGARNALAVSWGASDADFASVSADLFALDSASTMQDMNALVEQLKQNPHITRYASERRVREAEMRLIASDNRSDVGWNVGIRHLADSDDVALVGGVSISLFANERNQSAIAATEAATAELPLQQAAMLQQLQTQLIEMYQRRQAAIETLATLQDKVIPELRRALSETRQAYDRGRYGYMELVAAQRELNQARQAAVNAAATAHQAQLKIERLTGEPLLVAEATNHLEVIQ